MVDDVVLIGRSGAACPALGEALRQTGLVVHERGAGVPPLAAMLVTHLATAGEAIEEARIFAAGERGGRSRLIVLTRAAAEKDDWPASREAAIITAFIRHAALANAAFDIRVNGLELCGNVTDEDIADAVLAMWRWRSMTGQTIRLGLR